uniref:hypothetical protein n=1 Tax=uncultured Polaribacter sp. TaxID=174711 RepID=UPI00261F4D7F|nr:hypothetical protein [uncultured Polaribacter sp.]
MGKNKKKKKLKINYKLIVLFGGVFHLITYFLFNETLDTDNLLLLSIIIGGITLGLFFIKRLELTNPKSYRKLKGVKLKSVMILICSIMIFGGAIIFGNVLNGLVLGLNYLGRDSETSIKKYSINKIARYRKSGKRRMFSQKPKVYFFEEGKIQTLILSEFYSSQKDYTKFKTIELEISQGLLGFDYIENYNLQE